MINTNSIVIDKLLSYNTTKINSAIIIMNGTELYNNPEYTALQKSWKNDEIDNKTFSDRAIELYIALGNQYGLNLSTENITV